MASPSSRCFRYSTLVVFFCPVCCVLRSSTVGKQQGNPRLFPLAGCLKTLAAAQKASGWPGQAYCAPADFELDSCKSTHCYSPGTCCLADFQTSALRSSPVFSATSPGSLCSASHHTVIPNIPIEFPPSAHSVIACFVLSGKVSIVKGSFNKRGIAWKGQERASGEEPPSDED